jgi:hypothetical protein
VVVIIRPVSPASLWVVLERDKQSLPREDRELAMALCSQFTAEGIRMEFGAEMRCGEINKRGKHFHIHGAKGKEEAFVADFVLFTTQFFIIGGYLGSYKSNKDRP